MASKTKKASPEVATRYVEPKRVSVQKANNGYVVSSYTDNGERVEVAKTMDVANKIVKKMLRK